MNFSSCKPVARVHVQAVGAVVDLPNTQVHQIYQNGRQAALRDVPAHVAKCLNAGWRDATLRETYGAEFAKGCRADMRVDTFLKCERADSLETIF
jgi:hypothetical protein